MPQVSTGKLPEWSIFKGDNRAAKTDNSWYCPIWFSCSRAWTTLAKISGSAHGSASIQTRATFGLPAKCHSDGVSVAGRKWPDCTCLLGVDQFWILHVFIPRSWLCSFLVFGLFQWAFNFTLIHCQHPHFPKNLGLKTLFPIPCWWMPKIKKKKDSDAYRSAKELDVHKTKQKRDRNRTTTSLVLDSSIQRGRWEFCLNQRIWLRLSSVFESRRISFLKIFLVCHDVMLWHEGT